MYLKSIKAQGFKSFADKLDLEINPGITGIVGPNGSGKSNIVDAIRWVLGEQSVKSLRGDKGMTDCIFSGSQTREAQKRAMVALTFDNNDKTLNSDFSEIEIKRVIYASGDNEYFINNSRVRLKDITDLFIDSGAGGTSFNIISQGNVTDIVNSKSSDRRLIFESAAGVLKYKKRKEESLKKLEKTEENITRIKLITKELSDTVEPLKEQSTKAKKYLEIKENLENIDIALMAKDITDYNLEYSNLKSEISILQEKLSDYELSTEDHILEKKKLESIKIDDDINKKNEELNSLVNKINDLTSEKKLTIERGKYEVDNKAIDDNLVKLKEESLDGKNRVDILNQEIKSIEDSVASERNKLDEIKNKSLVIKVKKSTTNNALMEGNKQVMLLQNKIDILENNIISGEASPLSVRSILNNPRLKGIHNTIGKVIEVEDKYMVACDIALGASNNYIIVDNDKVAIEAIDFLKDRKLGRATFFPLNVIKERSISEEVINSIKSLKGYIGILSDLVTYDKLYDNIVKNQLGQVIVVEDTKTLNTIGKLIDYKYRVVSLDGEIIHVGGSITGGTTKKMSILNEKNELNKLKEELNVINNRIKSLNDELDSLDNDLQDLEEKEMVVNKYIILYNEELFNKRTSLSRFIDHLKSIENELSGMNDLKNNSLDKHLEELLVDISDATKEKELLENEIKKLKTNKSNLTDEINNLEHSLREKNSSFNAINNELKSKEVLAGKLEVRLDNLLDNLNEEYNLTYDAALVKYTLDIDPDIARDKVTELKKSLNKLGEVNIGSIKEYERISTRYDFLIHQQDDLENSKNELMGIIKDMDSIMTDKFKTSFESIKKEFERIFRLMFKGGKGELVLCDENDLLNTGVDIIAIPPGKKINSPLSLSGGEKALTAICLLFAMLQVKPSPFVILDEAEAALDEVNVDMFGKYLNNEKNKSQFIVITHKKRMMEYADSLYGITMQESGVSKIVSAKLEETN